MYGEFARKWVVQVDEVGRWKGQIAVWDYADAVRLAGRLLASGVARTVTVGYYKRGSVNPFAPPKFVGVISYCESMVDARGAGDEEQEED